MSDLSQGEKGPLSNQTGFFRKLPDRGGLQIFTRFKIPLGDRPYAVIFTSPIRASGVNQQDFESILGSNDAIHEEAGADLHPAILS